MAACKPGCTCKRHGRPKCADGCVCVRHTPEFRAKMVAAARKSWEGATTPELRLAKMEAAHAAQKPCEPGCTCGRHGGAVYVGPSYDSRHKAVYQARGKAADHTCADCTSAAAEWAQIHETDGTDPLEHYQPMCIRCHRSYDGWGDVMRAHKVDYWSSVAPEDRKKFMRDIAEKGRSRKMAEEGGAGDE